MQDEQEQGGVVLPLSILPLMCPFGLRAFGLREKAAGGLGGGSLGDSLYKVVI